MDPGIDDALALLLAVKSPEIKILGITTVAGNASVEVTSDNVRKVLEYLKVSNIPVAKGAARPLSRPLDAALHYHGPDGLAQSNLPPSCTPLHPEKAWDFLARVILDAPGEITLLATGPLTNIATAFQSYPELPGALDRLVLMGGAYGFTPYSKRNQILIAEFNIWQDPEAAQIVFDSGADIFAVGMDVTMDPEACLNKRHLERIKIGHTPAAHLATRLVEYAIEQHGYCAMHDPLALAILLDDSLVDFKSVKVKVTRGDGWNRGIVQIIPEKEASELTIIHVASAVDGPRFVNLFLSRILDK